MDSNEQRIRLTPQQRAPLFHLYSILHPIINELDYKLDILHHNASHQQQPSLRGSSSLSPQQRLFLSPILQKDGYDDGTHSESSMSPKSVASLTSKRRLSANYSTTSSKDSPSTPKHSSRVPVSSPQMKSPTPSLSSTSQDLFNYDPTLQNDALFPHRTLSESSHVSNSTGSSTSSLGPTPTSRRLPLTFSHTITMSTFKTSYIRRYEAISFLKQKESQLRLKLNLLSILQEIVHLALTRVHTLFTLKIDKLNSLYHTNTQVIDYYNELIVDTEYYNSLCTSRLYQVHDTRQALESGGSFQWTSPSHFYLASHEHFSGRFVRPGLFDIVNAIPQYLKLAAISHSQVLSLLRLETLLALSTESLNLDKDFVSTLSSYQQKLKRSIDRTTKLHQDMLGHNIELITSVLSSKKEPNQLLLCYTNHYYLELLYQLALKMYDFVPHIVTSLVDDVDIVKGDAEERQQFLQQQQLYSHQLSEEERASMPSMLQYATHHVHNGAEDSHLHHHHHHHHDEDHPNDLHDDEDSTIRPVTTDHLSTSGTSDSNGTLEGIHDGLDTPGLSSSSSQTKTRLATSTSFSPLSHAVKRGGSAGSRHHTSGSDRNDMSSESDYVNIDNTTYSHSTHDNPSPIVSSVSHDHLTLLSVSPSRSGGGGGGYLRTSSSDRFHSDQQDATTTTAAGSDSADHHHDTTSADDPRQVVTFTQQPPSIAIQQPHDDDDNDHDDEKGHIDSTVATSSENSILNTSLPSIASDISAYPASLETFISSNAASVSIHQIYQVERRKLSKIAITLQAHSPSIRICTPHSLPIFNIYHNQYIYRERVPTPSVPLSHRGGGGHMDVRDGVAESIGGCYINTNVALFFIQEELNKKCKTLPNYTRYREYLKYVQQQSSPSSSATSSLLTNLSPLATTTSESPASPLSPSSPFHNSTVRHHAYAASKNFYADKSKYLCFLYNSTKTPQPAWNDYYRTLHQYNRYRKIHLQYRKYKVERKLKKSRLMARSSHGGAGGVAGVAGTSSTASDLAATGVSSTPTSSAGRRRTRLSHYQHQYPSNTTNMSVGTTSLPSSPVASMMTPADIPSTGIDLGKRQVDTTNGHDDTNPSDIPTLQRAPSSPRSPSPRSLSPVVVVVKGSSANNGSITPTTLTSDHPFVAHSPSPSPSLQSALISNDHDHDHDVSHTINGNHSSATEAYTYTPSNSLELKLEIPQASSPSSPSIPMMTSPQNGKSPLTSQNGNGDELSPYYPLSVSSSISTLSTVAGSPSWSESCSVASYDSTTTTGSNESMHSPASHDRHPQTYDHADGLQQQTNSLQTKTTEQQAEPTSPSASSATSSSSSSSPNRPASSTTSGKSRSGAGPYVQVSGLPEASIARVNSEKRLQEQFETLSTRYFYDRDHKTYFNLLRTVQGQPSLATRKEQFLALNEMTISEFFDDDGDDDDDDDDSDDDEHVSNNDRAYHEKKQQFSLTSPPEVALQCESYHDALSTFKKQHTNGTGTSSGVGGSSSVAGGSSCCGQDKDQDRATTAAGKDGQMQPADFQKKHPVFSLLSDPYQEYQQQVENQVSRIQREYHRRQRLSQMKRHMATKQQFDLQSLSFHLNEDPAPNIDSTRGPFPSSLSTLSTSSSFAMPPSQSNLFDTTSSSAVSSAVSSSSPASGPSGGQHQAHHQAQHHQQLHQPLQSSFAHQYTHTTSSQLGHTGHNTSNVSGGAWPHSTHPTPHGAIQPSSRASHVRNVDYYPLKAGTAPTATDHPQYQGSSRSRVANASSTQHPIEVNHVNNVTDQDHHQQQQQQQQPSHVDGIPSDDVGNSSPTLSGSAQGQQQQQQQQQHVSIAAGTPQPGVVAPSTPSTLDFRIPFALSSNQGWDYVITSTRDILIKSESVNSRIALYNNRMATSLSRHYQQQFRRYLTPNLTQKTHFLQTQPKVCCAIQHALRERIYTQQQWLQKANQVLNPRTTGNRSQRASQRGMTMQASASYHHRMNNPQTPSMGSVCGSDNASTSASESDIASPLQAPAPGSFYPPGSIDKHLSMLLSLDDNPVSPSDELAGSLDDGRLPLPGSSTTSSNAHPPTSSGARPPPLFDEFDNIGDVTRDIPCISLPPSVIALGTKNFSLHKYYIDGISDVVKLGQRYYEDKQFLDDKYEADVMSSCREFLQVPSQPDNDSNHGHHDNDGDVRDIADHTHDNTPEHASNHEKTDSLPHLQESSQSHTTDIDDDNDDDHDNDHDNDHHSVNNHNGDILKAEGARQGSLSPEGTETLPALARHMSDPHTIQPGANNSLVPPQHGPSRSLGGIGRQSTLLSASIDQPQNLFAPEASSPPAQAQTPVPSSPQQSALQEICTHLQKQIDSLDQTPHFCACCDEFVTEKPYDFNEYMRSMDLQDEKKRNYVNLRLQEQQKQRQIQQQIESANLTVIHRYEKDLYYVDECIRTLEHSLTNSPNYHFHLGVTPFSLPGWMQTGLNMTSTPPSIENNSSQNQPSSSENRLPHQSHQGHAIDDNENEDGQLTATEEEGLYIPTTNGFQPVLQGYRIRLNDDQMKQRILAEQEMTRLARLYLKRQQKRLRKQLLQQQRSAQAAAAAAVATDGCTSSEFEPGGHSVHHHHHNRHGTAGTLDGSSDHYIDPDTATDDHLHPARLLSTVAHAHSTQPSEVAGSNPEVNMTSTHDCGPIPNPDISIIPLDDTNLFNASSLLFANLQQQQQHWPTSDSSDTTSPSHFPKSPPSPSKFKLDVEINPEVGFIKSLPIQPTLPPSTSAPTTINAWLLQLPLKPRLVRERVKPQKSITWRAREKPIAPPPMLSSQATMSATHTKTDNQHHHITAHGGASTNSDVNIGINPISGGGNGGPSPLSTGIPSSTSITTTTTSPVTGTVLPSYVQMHPSIQYLYQLRQEIVDNIANYLHPQLPPPPSGELSPSDHGRAETPAETPASTALVALTHNTTHTSPDGLQDSGSTSIPSHRSILKKDDNPSPLQSGSSGPSLLTLSLRNQHASRSLEPPSGSPTHTQHQHHTHSHTQSQAKNQTKAKTQSDHESTHLSSTASDPHVKPSSLLLTPKHIASTPSKLDTYQAVPGTGTTQQHQHQYQDSRGATIASASPSPLSSLPSHPTPRGSLPPPSAELPQLHNFVFYLVSNLLYAEHFKKNDSLFKDDENQKSDKGPLNNVKSPTLGTTAHEPLQRQNSSQSNASATNTPTLLSGTPTIASRSSSESNTVSTTMTTATTTTVATPSREQPNHMTVINRSVRQFVDAIIHPQATKRSTMLLMTLHSMCIDKQELIWSQLELLLNKREQLYTAIHDCEAFCDDLLGLPPLHF